METPERPTIEMGLWVSQIEEDQSFVALLKTFREQKASRGLFNLMTDLPMLLL